MICSTRKTPNSGALWSHFTNTHREVRLWFLPRASHFLRVFDGSIEFSSLLQSPVNEDRSTGFITMQILGRPHMSNSRPVGQIRSFYMAQHAYGCLKIKVYNKEQGSPNPWFPDWYVGHLVPGRCDGINNWLQLSSRFHLLSSFKNRQKSVNILK